MGKQKIFTLRPEWLAHLIDNLGRAKSPFAPSLDKSFGLSPDDIGSLKKEGILGSDDNLTPEAKEALSTLVAARAVVRVRISRGEGYLENNVYLGEGPDQWALLVNQSPHLILRYPITPREALREARELMGESVFSSLALEEDLDLGQALALAAVVDVARKEMLTALAQDRVETEPLLEQEQVLRWALAPSSNAQWLTVIIKGIIPEPEANIDLKAGLSSLAEKELIKIDGNRLSLEPKTSFLATRLLLIDKLFSLRAIYQTTEGPAQVGFVAVQGGVNDVLMLECLGSSVRFTGISPAEVLETAEEVIKNLAVLADKIPEESVPKSEVQDKPLCPSCRSEVLPNAKFCPFCGTPLQPKVAEKKENTCPNCQNPVLPQAKFCPSCGEKLV